MLLQACMRDAHLLELHQACMRDAICLHEGRPSALQEASQRLFPLGTVFQQPCEMGWWDAAGITLDMVKGPPLSRVLHRFSLSGETS